MKQLLFLVVSLVAPALGRGLRQAHEEYEGPICVAVDPYFKEGLIFLVGAAYPVIEVGGTLRNFSSEGLSTQSWKLYMDYENFEMNATLHSKLERLTGNASYTTFGFLDARPLRPETFPSGNFTGAGRGGFSVKNLQFQGTATLVIDSLYLTLKLKTLQIKSLHFDSVWVDLGEEFVIGGETPNWAELSANFKANFEQDFANDRDGVTEFLRQAYNAFTNYTPEDLEDLLLGQVKC